MKKKIYSFKDENGTTVNYTVKEHILLNKSEYVIMCPENDSSLNEIYKFTNDSLELVENKVELSDVKSHSHIFH